MDNPIEEIKKKIDIVGFINSYIATKKFGRNFNAPCPFHQERTPSFVISPERQIWHCFGACQEGGDIFKFLMKWENITFPEALKELAQKAGIPLRSVQFEDHAWKKKERLFEINAMAEQFFEHLLWNTKFGESGVDFLSSRTIHKEAAKKFHIGYAPDSWDSLLKFLKKKKFQEKEIFETGLLVKGQSGNLYDRFRGRLMFPIKDVRGNIIGFSGRSLQKKDTSAKYINIPESLLYRKRETLFGLDLAKEAIKKEKNAYVVEGEFDVISPYQNGFENFIAIKGSALTKEQLMLLKKYTDRITLALDSDAAGTEAMKRGIEEAEAMDFDISIVFFDFAKDPDEAVRTDRIKFKKALGNAVPIYDFIVQSAQKKYSPDNPFNKKKIAEEVIPFISTIKNPIVQSHYFKKLSEVLGVDIESVRSLAKKKQDRKKEEISYSFQKKNSMETRNILLEKYILSLVLQEGSEEYKTGGVVFSVIEPDDFSIPSYKKIAKAFLEFQKKFPGAFKLASFVDFLEKELQPVCDEIYLFASYETEFVEQNLEKLACEMKRNMLKKKITDLIKEESKDEIKRDEEIKNIALRLKEVEKKLLTV